MKKLIILLFLCFSSSILAEDIGYKNILSLSFIEQKILKENYFKKIDINI
jgi:hypothetical protein